MSHRDPHFCYFWNERGTQEKAATAVANFWEKHLTGKWYRTQCDCTF